MRLQSARAALALQLVVLLLVLNLASTKWPRGAWLLFQHGPLALRQRPAESSIPELQLSTERFAYVTLVNNARYVELCSVLAASLHASGAQHPLLVLALPEALRSDTGVDALRLMPGVTVLPIRPLPITPNIKLDQPHWLFAFCKLRIWQLTDYSRLVYIDGDSLVLRNLDYLFTIPLPPGRIAAARDVHACNQTLALVHMMSSLMVLSPSQEIFAGLLAMMPRSRWNNGDQQLIRAYFSRQHGVQLLNETDAAFVHRCRCNDFGAAGRPGTATGPALVHFTTAFAPQWDDNSKLATTRRMEPHGWCRTRTGSVSCTHCADLAYEHWINLRSGLGNTSVPG